MMTTIESSLDLYKALEEALTSGHLIDNIKVEEDKLTLTTRLPVRGSSPQSWSFLLVGDARELTTYDFFKSFKPHLLKQPDVKRYLRALSLASAPHDVVEKAMEDDRRLRSAACHVYEWIEQQDKNVQLSFQCTLNKTGVIEQLEVTAMEYTHNLELQLTPVPQLYHNAALMELLHETERGKREVKRLTSYLTPLLHKHFGTHLALKLQTLREILAT